MLRKGAQPFVVAIVAAEDADHLDIARNKGLERKGSAEIPGVEHHRYSLLLHRLQQRFDRREPIIRVRQEANFHGAALQ